jgi:divinyl protochlorophyllide a 8-vinyl-reductase
MVASAAQREHTDAWPAPKSAQAAVAHSETAGRIGPNAIIRVAEALRERLGEDATADIFRGAGLATYLRAAPDAMVVEEEVARLQAQLRAALGATLAAEISRDAGVRTGDYLLAHRIPRVAQVILKLLPPGLAATILARAIGKHAWTFAGTGTFLFQAGRPFRLAIAGCPLCREIEAEGPACDYYAATFERIFRVLVSRRARVTETACIAAGGDACRFRVDW